MLPTGKRYPRLLPPVFLSPIYECEEEAQYLTVKSDSYIAEVNNSSVISNQTSATTCSLDGVCCVSGDEGSSTKVEKAVIESCSGRKLEDVEVLKQKYINSEIQDLPRFLAGSNGYHRIWKTRRTNLNLGSQDIRNQMGKLNLKLGTSPAHVDGERNIDYRCKIYNTHKDASLGIRKSAEEILYGDFINADDYDPELAALFENYIEDCDNVTKKHFSEFPTLQESERENILSKYQMDPDSEHAFLCGFIEGMRQTDNPSRFRSPEHEDIVHGSELIDNTVQNVASHRDIICSKQDITHMSLREWENVHRSQKEQKDQRRQRLMKTNVTNQIITPRRVRSNDDNTKVAIPVEADSKDDAGDSCKDAVVFREAIHALKTMTIGKRPVNVKKTKTEVGHEDMLDEEHKTIKAARRSCLQDSLHCRYSNKHIAATLNRAKFTPSMREKSVNENKYRAVDMKHLSNEDENIVQLAKKKLEHSMFTSQALEDTYVSMLRARIITNDCKAECSRKFKRDLSGSRTNVSEAKTKGLIIPYDLDGWTTKCKAFCDQESVQVSSPDVLHPVDSFEKFVSPLWTPTSISSPHINPIGAQTPINASDSTVWDYEASIVKPSDKGNGTKEAVRKAAKQNHFGVMGDYRNAAKLVKLRLTKSNDTVGNNAATLVDKSFANVPLSQCANYSIEQNLKSSSMLTTNINLSEKLAQQLRDLSNDRKRSSSRHRENKLKIPLEQSHTAKPKTESLPPVSGSSLKIDRPKSHKASPDDSNSLFENNKYSSSESGSFIPRQVGREHNGLESTSEYQSLPHISVTSYPSKPPLEDNIKKLAKIQENNDDNFKKGAAVRASTCTSPYTFDKGDPQLLQLKAKSLPPFHKVCTSCGGISKYQENMEGKLKRMLTRKEIGAKNSGTIKNCCKTYAEDRWKLADKRPNNLKVSSTGTEKRLGSCSHNESKEEEYMASKSQIMFSPTTTKQKCEEMSINFMNKSIKFRFQCDVSLEGNDQNGDKDGDKTGQWLNNISTPTFKDRYQCPVATETRIYKDTVRRISNDRREATPQAPVSSPYLDYCKIKADLLAKRKEELRETTEYLSDTCLTKDIYLKAAKKCKRFPVLPMKKNRDSPRTIRGQSSSKNNLVSSRPNSNCDLIIRSTKPAKLPCMKTMPYDINTENVNNNVHTWYDSRSNENISPEHFNILLKLNHL